MGKKTKFYLVAADALPEIFLKVAEAKRMLHAGEVSTAGEAARQVGISRSAFYKYRDSVQPFNDMKTGRIITFYALLKDNPGVLSNVLSIFAGSGANILTINQSIPTNGCAAVTISAETSDMRESPAPQRRRAWSSSRSLRAEPAGRVRHTMSQQTACSLPTHFFAGKRRGLLWALSYRNSAAAACVTASGCCAP